MTPCVTDKRDKENLRWQSIEVAYCLKAKPRFASRRIVFPVLDFVPLFWTIAPSGDEAVPILHRLSLTLHYVYGRFREILQTPGMIEIEVGKHNMAHV